MKRRGVVVACVAKLLSDEVVPLKFTSVQMPASSSGALIEDPFNIVLHKMGERLLVKKCSSVHWVL